MYRPGGGGDSRGARLMGSGKKPKLLSTKDTSTYVSHIRTHSWSKRSAADQMMRGYNIHKHSIQHQHSSPRGGEKDGTHQTRLQQLFSAQALSEAIERSHPSLSLASAHNPSQGGVQICHQAWNLTTKMGGGAAGAGGWSGVTAREPIEHQNGSQNSQDLPRAVLRLLRCSFRAQNYRF